ncbi:ABCA5 [Cordylochernes scorpioides]|uniref:ABCA5 n=1 Tax=Cordylochernes scorpioides TaxID=51811 RepID=A0ABY6JUZ3_9ARAC|nr:ABCA5 [Cordylochernes scorpioides]
MVELSELSYYRYCRITVCYLIGRRSGHRNMVELSPSVELTRIRDLVKVFSKTGQPTVRAVNDCSGPSLACLLGLRCTLEVCATELSLTIYEGQITALLGHNGAGKSTLIHMLTGVMPLTEGKAWLYGHSPTSNLSALRNLMGVCLQDDVFHPNLNAVQHLQIFAGIKNIILSPEQTEPFLQDLGLYEVKDLPAEKLSGGQKRKLCVGMALVGDPKVVILDEPTSGVDVASRHQIWDLLRRKKEGRVIMITTHSMEEADILAGESLTLP